MSPVVLGLVLAIPLAILTARQDCALISLGLLQIPEEAAIPPILARAATLARTTAQSRAIPMPARLLGSPQFLAIHCALLMTPRRSCLDASDIPLLIARAKLEDARDANSAWDAMTKPERIAYLSDATALASAPPLLQRTH
jgi:membrane glycosyltransferase